MFGQITSTISRLYDTYMPAFWLRLKPRYQWAIGIAVVVAAWLATGLILHPRHAASDDGAQAKTTGDMPTVKVRMLVASDRNATLTVRGRTQALH